MHECVCVCVEQWGGVAATLSFIAFSMQLCAWHTKKPLQDARNWFPLHFEAPPKFSTHSSNEEILALPRLERLFIIELFIRGTRLLIALQDVLNSFFLPLLTCCQMNSQREKPQRFSCQITCVEKLLETSGRHLHFPFCHLLFFFLFLFFFKCFHSYFIYFSHLAIHIGLCSRFRLSLFPLLSGPVGSQLLIYSALPLVPLVLAFSLSLSLFIAFSSSCFLFNHLFF